MENFHHTIIDKNWRCSSGTINCKNILRSQPGAAQSILLSEPGAPQNVLRSQPGAAQSILLSEPGAPQNILRSQPGAAQAFMQNEPGPRLQIRPKADHLRTSPKRWQQKPKGENKGSPKRLQQKHKGESKERQKLCQWCKRNGETPEVYESHLLRVNNEVVCPYLSKYVCSCCGATGKNAHTLQYCPKYKKERLPLKQMMHNAIWNEIHNSK